MAPCLGGGERDRTAGLDVANVALSQLSYTPKTFKLVLLSSIPYLPPNAKTRVLGPGSEIQSC